MEEYFDHHPDNYSGQRYSPYSREHTQRRHSPEDRGAYVFLFIFLLSFAGAALLLAELICPY